MIYVNYGVYHLHDAPNALFLNNNNVHFNELQKKKI